MLKNKKSFAVILSLVMLLAMACGAWAATGYFDANGSANSISNASGDVTVSGDENHGLMARNGGTILYTGGGTISTSGDKAYGAYSVQAGSSLDLTGNIVTHGVKAHGLVAYKAYAKMNGDITTYDTGDPVNLNNGIVEFSGNLITLGDAAPGEFLKGVLSYGSSDFYATNGTFSVSMKGERGVGLSATHYSTITVANGTITVDKESSYCLFAGEDSVINLNDIEAQGQNLLLSGTPTSSANGVVNATDSALSGNILHSGVTDGTLEINLTNTSLEGAAEASGDIGVIDITLVGSAWDITGDSNTNGTVTGDGNSTISYTLSPEDTEVIIDKLKGNAGIDMKIGDTLIIKNPDGDISSDNPDVIEVVVDEVTGEVSIISKADGEADLTYSYIDENGRIQTVTVTVVSGAGSNPEGNGTGGGGSSNCNAGMGIGALFSLLGLALVMRKK